MPTRIIRYVNMCFGLLMLTLFEQNTSLKFIDVALVVFGFGFGLFSSPNTNMLMRSLEGKFYGIASFVDKKEMKVV